MTMNSKKFNLVITKKQKEFLDTLSAKISASTGTNISPYQIIEAILHIVSNLDIQIDDPKTEKELEQKILDWFRDIK